MTSTRPGTRPGIPETPRDGGTPVPGAWLHLVCCGAPLLIILAITVGASVLAWVAIPVGVLAAIVVAVLAARRRVRRAHTGHPVAAPSGPGDRDPGQARLP